ncbi:hypothetical protein K402DRAFT_335047 [Aulographum hederae CBS 113979]|uniref:Dipeptidyl-peptidase V n=1 Tax=Aulographum hederae CBS 113979 TaxID=1176131 RepID=A0A6G1GWC0_9PEZI|nr:hypothetical protein K402DRAFT_335047 [Aulographum hederae CBS 113979]
MLSALVLALAPLVLGITPEQMLYAPRRSDAVPNPSGEWALFSSDEDRSLLNLATGEIKPINLSTSDASEVLWLGPKSTSILYLNATNDDVPGGVTLWTSDVLALDQKTKIASFDAPYSGLKAVVTDSGDIKFVVNCLAWENGTAYNELTATTPASTGRLYSTIYVRHWSTYLTAQRYAAFAGTLTAQSNYSNSTSYSLSPLKNLLVGIEIPVTRPETPVQPFGDAGDYDISPDGSTVAFLSKAPELAKANYTASYIYLVPHDGSAVAAPINGPNSQSKPAAAKGASSSPRFSPDGKSIAYVQQDGIEYEADRNKLYVADLSGNSSTIKALLPDWDRSIDGMTWAKNGKTLYLSVGDRATSKLFNVPLDADSSFVPKNLTDASSSMASYYLLPDESVLVASSAIWSSRDFYLLGTNGTKTSLFKSNEVDEGLAGLGPHSVSEFWFTGSLGIELQSWIIKPSNFSPNKTYPLAFIVHGGPQGAHSNSWSTRWNFQTWADQGYVVIAPNPTGSTSFGQNLTDLIQNNWGSYPYEDLVLCWEYVAANLSSFIDVERGIEAGASYGGYMTNWIQGHDLGRKFKALVTHDGSTSTLAQLTSEELWFMQHDFNGTLWDDYANYERWDPIRHARNFSTPHFVVHNELDYRLPVGEGIMLFNVLQELGVPSRFLNFPDENHWVLKRENSLVWHNEIFNWINYYSGISDTLDDNAIKQ